MVVLIQFSLNSLLDCRDCTEILEDRLSVSMLKLFDWHHGNQIPSFNSLTRLLAESCVILTLLHLQVFNRKKKL